MRKANKGTLLVTDQNGNTFTFVPVGETEWQVAPSPTMCWNESDKALPTLLRSLVDQAKRVSINAGVAVSVGDYGGREAMNS